MENNNTMPVGTPAPDKKGGFWKGFIIGVVTMILLGVIGVVAVLFAGSLLVNRSLDTAREKGNTAALKANLLNIRAQAEILFDMDGSYAGICGAPTISSMLAASKLEAKGGDVVCLADADSYAIGATYVDGGKDQTFCVDSAGNSMPVAGKASDVIKGANFVCR